MPRSPHSATITLLALGLLSSCSTPVANRQVPATPTPVVQPSKPVVAAAGGYSTSAVTGLPLYLYIQDKRALSTCVQACAQNFAAEPAPANVVAPFGSIAGQNGIKQLTYGGRPLYTYIADVPNAPPRGHLAFSGWIPFVE